jgi:DNA repair protein RecN (Recombination protein N)
VLCVTHLAQVAAFADTQVAVEKAVEQARSGRRGGGNGAVTERTVARAQVLTGDARVAELSRMLAGTGSSARARELAAELLAEAARR